MAQRRLLLAVVALVAGLLLVARCGLGDSAEPPDPVGASPRAADGAVDRPDTGASGPGDQTDTDAAAVDAPPPATAPAPPAGSMPDDDGALPEGTSASPTGPAQPEAIAAAEGFARAWVRGDAGWSDRLAELATPELARTLREADPATVPAATVTGPGDVLSEVPGWASVGVPTDAGTLVLHVVETDDGWLVSAIDWRPRW